MCSLIIDTQKLHKSLINKETPLLGEGLEPSRLTAPEPKSGVSANFTTRAKEYVVASRGHDMVARLVKLVPN